MNVMIIRPASIGDGDLCLPVAAANRRALPDSRVTMLSSEHSAPLFDHHPDVHQAKTVDGNVRLRELIELVRAAFDAAVFLMPYRRLMWAAFLASVPIRVATGYCWYSVPANRRVYQHWDRLDQITVDQVAAFPWQVLKGQAKV